MLTDVTLKQIIPLNNNYAAWLKPLNMGFLRLNITSPGAIAMFMAQCSHESHQFKILSENLNYSADGLMKTFPKYFKTIQIAAEYARQPERIANKVYANRMGNGSEASGDGWKYRGKSILQCTGKNNHTAFALTKKMTVEDVCKYLLTIDGSVEFAMYFWETNNLTNLVELKNVPVATKIINGGAIGLAHRTSEYVRILAILTAR